MFGKTMMSAAVSKISPVTVISAVACERAKNDPVIIYRKRMRSSDNINSHGIICPLASQRLNVTVPFPEENHDGFVNCHHPREKTVMEKRNPSPIFCMRIRKTDTNLLRKIDLDRSGCKNYQHIKNTGGAVVTVVKQPLHCTPFNLITWQNCVKATAWMPLIYLLCTGAEYISLPLSRLMRLHLKTNLLIIVCYTVQFDVSSSDRLLEGTWGVHAGREITIRAPCSLLISILQAFQLAQACRHQWCSATMPSGSCALFRAQQALGRCHYLFKSEHRHVPLKPHTWILTCPAFKR